MAINKVMSSAQISKQDKASLIDAVKNRDGALIAEIAAQYLVNDNMVIINQGNRKGCCMASVTLEYGVLMQDGKTKPRAWKLDGTEYDATELLKVVRNG